MSVRHSEVEPFDLSLAQCFPKLLSLYLNISLYQKTMFKCHYGHQHILEPQIVNPLRIVQELH